MSQSKGLLGPWYVSGFQAVVQSKWAFDHAGYQASMGVSEDAAVERAHLAAIVNLWYWVAFGWTVLLTIPLFVTPPWLLWHLTRWALLLWLNSRRKEWLVARAGVEVRYNLPTWVLASLWLLVTFVGWLPTLAVDAWIAGIQSGSYL